MTIQEAVMKEIAKLKADINKPIKPQPIVVSPAEYQRLKK